MGDAHTYWECFLPTLRHDGTIYRVIITCQAGMGPIESAVKAAAAVERWRPAHVLLVGIAGGVLSRRGSPASPGREEQACPSAPSARGLVRKVERCLIRRSELSSTPTSITQADELATGDVVVATQVVDYGLGKWHPDSRRTIRWASYRPDPVLLESAVNYPAETDNPCDYDWKPRVRLGRPDGSKRDPELHFGVVATGGDVIASAEIIAAYQDHWEKLVAVEMEGSGIAAVLQASSERPRFLLIKALSDIANAGRNSATKAVWRGYACESAAAYACGLLHSGPVPGKRRMMPPQTGRPDPSLDGHLFTATLPHPLMYWIEGGWRRQVDTKQVFTPDRMAKATAFQDVLKLPEAPRLSANAILVRADGVDAVYLLDDFEGATTRRLVRNPDDLKKYGLDLESVHSIGPDVLAAIEEGPPVGTLPGWIGLPAAESVHDLGE